MSGLRSELSALVHFVDYPGPDLANRSPSGIWWLRGAGSEARACGNIWIWVVICAQTGRTGESAQCHRKGDPVSAHLPWRKRLTGQKHGGTLSVMIVLDGLRGFRSATALKNTRAKPRQTASKMKEFIGVWSRGEEKGKTMRGHQRRKKKSSPK